MANLQTDINIFINRVQQKIGTLGDDLLVLDENGLDLNFETSLIRELSAAIYLFQNQTLSENFSYKIIHYLSEKANLYIIPLAIFDDSLLVKNILLPTGGYTQGATGPQGPAATIALGTVTTGIPGSQAAINNSGNSQAAIFDFTIPAGASGTNGYNGWSAVYALIIDGQRRVLEVVGWTGGTGTPPTPINVYLSAVGFTSDITQAIDVRGAAGIDGSTGSSGTNGYNGWSPIYAIINDSLRRVLQIIDWTGGTGAKPSTGGYVYSGGQTSNIALATDIRGPQGLQGDPFTINARGNLSDRNLYDNQGTGYTFLAEDTGDVYIKNSPLSGDWSPPISFVGEKGWSPLLNVVQDGQRYLIQVSDWTGGQGDKPANAGYLYPGGLTFNPSDATDFRGERGEFYIDATGPLSDRHLYDNQNRPYTFYANDNGNIYLKNSNTPADWTTGVQFTGNRGPAGPVGSQGNNGSNAFTITSSNFTVPAINANVNVDVLNTSWLAIGQIIYIETAGYYKVVAVISGVTATINNLGYTGNAIAATIITTGKKTSPGGLQGATGAGSIYIRGDATTLNSVRIAISGIDVMVQEYDGVVWQNITSLASPV